MVEPPVRVQRLTMRPSLVEFGKQVGRFVSGAGGRDLLRGLGRSTETGEASYPGPLANAPLSLQETGETYLFDAWGMRVQRSVEPFLAVPWTEMDKVSLQIQTSTMLGLQMLRVVFWPGQPQTFRTHHPECAKFFDPDREGYALAIVTAREIPQSSIDQMVAALAHAGHRFDGRLGQLNTGE